MIIVLFSVPAIIAAFIYKKNTKVNADVKFFFLWLIALFVINLFLLLLMNSNMVLSNIKILFSYIIDMVKTMDLTREAALLVVDEVYRILFLILESLAYLYIASFIIAILLPITIVLLENFVGKVKKEMKDDSALESKSKKDQSFLD